MPGAWPILDDFALDELREIESANLPHVASVAERDSADVWTVVATEEACRLTPLVQDSDISGGQLQRTTANWLLALAHSSPYAGPRRRFVVSGMRPDGTAFAITVYSLKTRVPRADETVAHLECVEDPVT